MKTAYCTNCQKVTMMKIAITELPVVDREGKVRQTTIENFYCLSCGLFVGSDEKTAISSGHELCCPQITQIYADKFKIGSKS